ncbi:MAG: flagellar basal body protein [Dysosmobacter sp.]|nr:flagellar basal body protein [Dysosmobacter sp.]
MGIGTFGSFTQARLAIYAAQTGLNVTGNNISNINTPGYTRQRLDQVSLYVNGSDRYYAEGDIRVGQGALVKSLSQIRSPYLDIRYRTVSADVGYTDARLSGLDQIADILDEVGKGDESKGEGGFGILGLDFGKLAAALRDMEDQTGHQEYDKTFRQIASNLIARFNTYANKLEEVKKNTIAEMKSNVRDINNYLTSIRTLNEEIRKSEIHGDPALELRDERNRQLDALSQLIDINVTYSEEEIAGGMFVEKLTVTLDNANPDKTVHTDEALLIDGVFSAQLSFGTPMLNPDYDPEKVDALKQELDNGNITQAEYDAQYEKLTSQYLKKNEDGTTSLASDIRDATILTDGENPLYKLMISELTNKRGDLHIGGSSYAAESLLAKDLPAGINWNLKTNTATVEEKDVPAPGDTTITIYRRQPKLDANGNPIKPTKDDDYTYTKQVYERIVTKPVALDDNDINGELQGNRELITEAGEFTDLDVIAGMDEGAGGKRGIPYYQRALDLLANQFANVLNEANQGFLTDPSGNYVTAGKNDAGEEIGVPVTITVNGVEEKVNKDWDSMSAAVQEELKNKTGLGAPLTDQDLKDAGITGKDILNAYLKGQEYDTTEKKFIPENREDTTDAAGNPVPGWGQKARGIFTGGVLFSNNPGNNDPSDITAANISISNLWEKTNNLLVASFTCVENTTKPASGASESITHMRYLLEHQEFEFVPTTLKGYENASGEPMFEGTFFQMWNGIGTDLGEDQTQTSTDLQTYYERALSIDTDRDSVSSVDFNDEAMNLMMYAKSYNAACRLMTTIDSVLDKLINNTGLTT